MSHTSHTSRNSSGSTNNDDDEGLIVLDAHVKNELDPENETDNDEEEGRLEVDFRKEVAALYTVEYGKGEFLSRKHVDPLVKLLSEWRNASGEVKVGYHRISSATDIAKHSAMFLATDKEFEWRVEGGDRRPATLHHLVAMACVVDILGTICVDECDTCVLKKGPFKYCKVVPGVAKNCCSNDLWIGKSLNRCSFNQDKVFRPSPLSTTYSAKTIHGKRKKNMAMSDDDDDEEETSSRWVAQGPAKLARMVEQGNIRVQATFGSANGDDEDDARLEKLSMMINVFGSEVFGLLKNPDFASDAARQMKLNGLMALCDSLTSQLKKKQQSGWQC